MRCHRGTPNKPLRDETSMLPFFSHSRPDKAWFSAGPASSFPDVKPEDDCAELANPRPCGMSNGMSNSAPGCKVFTVPKSDVAAASEVPLPHVHEGADLKDQVLVFRYRGKFHAIDHVS